MAVGRTRAQLLLIRNEEGAGQILKPPLKWAGGKRWLVQHLLPFWEPYRRRRLIEPFCGGLAVTIGLLPQRALLNDINPHLINFYRWVREGLTRTLPMKNSERLYYTYRKRFNNFILDGKAKSKEAAELFYFLNRTGYNGLCRLNSAGEFNVPFGSYKHINYAPDFSDHKLLFAKWEFTSEDFENLELNRSDFVYADPPYDVEFTKYSKESFSWNDQERLAEWLAKHPGPVVLSNQATTRIEELYKRLGYQLHFLEAPRRISCTGDRSPAREVLALRNLPHVT